MRQKQLTSEKSILYTSQSSMVYMYCFCLFVQKCSRIIHLFTQCCDVIFRQVFLGFVVMENCNQRLVSSIQCKYLNTIFEYNDIVIFIYSNYPFHQNTKSSDTKCFTPSIKCFFIWIKRLMYMKITMPLHSNLAFRNLQCRKH